jgi:hypothetical protein
MVTPLPESLLRGYEVPEYKGKAWGDLVDYSHTLSGIIHQHNADKAALKKILIRKPG